MTEVLQPLTCDPVGSVTGWPSAFEDGHPDPIGPPADEPLGSTAADTARRLLDDLERQVAALKSWAQEALRDHETLTCEVTTAGKERGR